jgi:rhamnulokinase
MHSRILVAVDLGAESCRVSLLRWSNGSPEVLLVHRFPNCPVAGPSGLRWDMRRIEQGVEEGLRRCAGIADRIDSIGVDGWAVDYARLGRDGKRAGDPFCYRDERLVAAEKQVRGLIPPERLYRLTGIQLLRINTLFQLYADNQAGLDPAMPWVNLPEYVTYWLGGRRVAEYTNATHTQLVGIGTKAWSREIFDSAGLEISAAPEIVSPGSIVGRLRGPLANLLPFRDTQLIVPAAHDTASAVAGIPAEGDDWAFISSGTWSLVGTTLDSPCANAEARKKNFTNLGGGDGRICFLKNVNGMWLLRQSMDQWSAEGFSIDIGELVQECERMPPADFLLDVDDPELLLPGDMPEKIRAQRQRRGRGSFPAGREGVLALANSILHSLAARYAEVLRDIAAITQKPIRRLYIVGGGSKNAFLNRLTAERTGLEVKTGSPESATLGNLAIQLASLEGGIGKGAQRENIIHWASILAASSLSAASGREARRSEAGKQ